MPDASSASAPAPDDGEMERHPVRVVLVEGLYGLGRALRRYWFLGVVLVLGVVLWQDMQPEAALLNDGPPAPDFALDRMNGEPFRLSDHRGEVVVLNIWATWCQPCHDEIPGFVDLQAQFADAGVTFVGLSIDKEGFAAVRPFARRYDVNYPQLVGPTVAWEKYGRTRTVPRTFVIDRTGQIRFRHTGLLLPGRLEPVLNKLTAETTPAR